MGEAVRLGPAPEPTGMEVVGVGEVLLRAQTKDEEVVTGIEIVSVLIEACEQISIGIKVWLRLRRVPK